LYLEKAYDTTWKYGILKDLFDMGLKGKLPNFISNFLSDREFNVRVNSTYSDIQEQEMGVPQGSILFGIGMTLANFQIDGKSPVSQMSFMRSKRTWSADSGRCLRSW
jgi:hypothetical protein